jgi:2-polyprenyl-6-methoxyphenol hydroxylase-like FAD-dependent oxidoreductase
MAELAKTRCCIAGGGPAGMMLGLLLARAGVQVMVLEKHADFLRDFRGDTIHPSTLQVMYELGLLEAFLKLPHERAETLTAQIGTAMVSIADFRHLPTRCKYIALMPQWDFLDFLAAQAGLYPNFSLKMRTEATGLIERDGRVSGVRVLTPEGEQEITAELVVAADGRHSTLREAAGLVPEEIGAPMDVLWMRLSRRPEDGEQTLGRIDTGRMLVMINRDRYWQCAYVIRKGGFEAIREAGLPTFRATLASLAPRLADRVGELASWDDVKLLTVAVNRLAKWHRPGLLCIGDAAHAMSPIGGVGVNLAVQDAVAAGNILAPVLQRGAAEDADLEAVQQRRMWPTVMTQRLQVAIQNRVIDRVLQGANVSTVPWVIRLLGAIPALQRLPARLVGMGFRPEHLQLPIA